MKYKISILLGLLMVSLCGSAAAMTMRAVASPLYAPDTILADSPFTVDIYMNNNDSVANNPLNGYRLALSMPLVFYSSDGSIGCITHRNVGESGPKGNIEYRNGFESFWGMFFLETPWSYDGSLPDSINFTGIGNQLSGWPFDLGEQLYIQFYLLIEEAGKFCIDSIGGQTPTYDWLFDPPSPAFNGPYCWEIFPFHTIDGTIEIKNHSTLIEEPYPLFKFTIFALNTDSSRFDTLVSTITWPSGYYYVSIPHTTYRLYYEFTSYQEPQLFTILRYSGAEIKDLYNTYSQGISNMTLDVLLDTNTYSIGNDWLYPALRMIKDLHTTDTTIPPEIILDHSIPIIAEDTLKCWWGWDSVTGYTSISMDINDWERQSICHEIGHEIFYILNNGWDQDPMQYSTFTDSVHRIFTVSDTIFAFMEGFAQFINAISSYPDSMYYNYQFYPQYIDSNTWWGGPDSSNTIGEIVEGAVASMLFDLYDDNQHPILRSDDDNVSNTSYMTDIIFDCIRNYGDSAQKTYSFPTFAERLVRDPNADWYHDSTTFIYLRDFICQIFINHRYTAAWIDTNYCDGANDIPFAETDTPVQPVEFNVAQNYPNPFNNSTLLKFTLPEKGECNLEIYNILGQRVWSKEWPELAAGEHTIILNDKSMKSLSSGVYLYRMTSGQNELTKKMLLLK